MKLRVVLQIGACQCVQDVDPGTRIALGEHHVEADHRHAVALEELVGQLGEEAAAPRPAPELAQALLVDIQDDDPLVASARHGHAQARVVQDVLQPGDERQAAIRGGIPMQRMTDQEKRDREA